MSHYHASIRLTVTAESRDELAAELHLAVEGLTRTCAEAVATWEQNPNRQGVHLADPLLSGGSVGVVLCRHADPLEN